MIGRRVYDTDVLEKGDYGKHPLDGIWYARAPRDHFIANLKKHTIVEHPDGTITVTPSILITYPIKGKPALTWHGFLTEGVWKEC